MKLLFHHSVLLASCVLAPTLAEATQYYVSPGGSNANSGLSAASPFQSLQHAASRSVAGDVIYAMNGTYSPYCSGCDVLQVTNSGTAAAPITFMAYPGAHPVIDASNAGAGIFIDASYIVVSGFEIKGDAQSITLAYAQAQMHNPSNFLTNANGILVTNSLNPSTPPSHITITGNLVHDMPGSGIQTGYADYITVSYNNVYRNEFWSPYDGSGISLWELRDTDNYTGYKNFIHNNYAYLNQNIIPSPCCTGLPSDGNGIIIDDNKNRQSNQIAYNGRTLVSNNLSFLNGGSGLHAWDSQHVDFFDNSAFGNIGTNMAKAGQIYGFYSNDIKIMNNIMYSPPNKNITSEMNDTNIVEDYNVLYSSTLQQGLKLAVTGPHDVLADPQFISPGLGNLHLNANSPAIGAGSPNTGVTVDIHGTPRPTGFGFDIGAYQYVPPG